MISISSLCESPFAIYIYLLEEFMSNCVSIKGALDPWGDFNVEFREHERKCGSDIKRAC